jgi:two-component system chemotaxis response regulator CheB
MATRTRVLVIDDSALMRQLLPEVLRHDPSLEVVGVAADPYAGWDKIKELQPDVLTLDVEMPRMDGLTFLERLMAMRPMPVVMVSSLTERSCATTLRALELGAVDFVSKPKLDVSSGTMHLAEEIIAKVKAAASARIVPRKAAARPSIDDASVAASHALLKSTHRVIAMGASTGGTEALFEILVALPADSPGIVAVIHMPEKFTKSYADRLDRACQIQVREAVHGDRILPGHALIAPGNFHMKAVRHGAQYAVEIEQTEPVNRHRPAVDVLFRSCADQLGCNAVGVILTGMGADGADGLVAMRRAGARTIAQDEASCVVFGMPKEAIARGGAEEVRPLHQIATRMLALSV